MEERQKRSVARAAIMLQVLRKGIKDIVVDEVPVPLCTPHHVLIRPVNSLISSGTETASIHQEGVLKEVADNPSHIKKIWDVSKMNGPIRTAKEITAKFSEYAVLGYSGAGVVVDKHATVTDLEVGDRVAYGGEGTGHAEVIITGRNLVARVPDGVNFGDASFATLGSIALSSVRVAGVGLGDVVVVLGLGLVGQLVAQLARLQGAVVIATDLRDDRVKLAKQLGAQHAVEGGGALAETVSELTNGRGADTVIVAAAAKSPAPCRQALQMCRDRGQIVIVGAVEIDLPWDQMYMKEIKLLMSRAYGPGSYDPVYEKQGIDYPVSYIRWTENRNMEEFLRLVDAKLLAVDPLVTHRYKLQSAPAAYQTIMDPAQASLAVLLEYSTPPDAPFVAKRRVDLEGTKQDVSGGVRFALVGAAGLARWFHLPNLGKVSGASLRAVHSSSGARGRSFSIRFRADYCTTDYGEILKDTNVDAVLITSRNQYHAKQAADALHAGKHVFVEKPMAITEEECRLVAEAAASSGRQLTVGFNRRFAPDYRDLKAQLDKRKGPAVVSCRVNSPGISGSFWMADPAIGGAILGEACHFVDLMYWMLNSEPVEVFAYSLPVGKKDPIGENNLAATFRFADGSIGTLNYSTVGSKTSAGERVEIFAPGLGGVAENFKSRELLGAIRTRRRRFWPQKGYAAQMQEFVDALRAGRAPAVTVKDGVRASMGCLAMLASAREGKPIPLSFT